MKFAADVAAAAAAVITVLRPAAACWAASAAVARAIADAKVVLTVAAIAAAVDNFEKPLQFENGVAYEHSRQLGGASSDGK